MEISTIDKHFFSSIQTLTEYVADHGKWMLDNDHGLLAREMLGVNISWDPLVEPIPDSFDEQDDGQEHGIYAIKVLPSWNEQICKNAEMADGRRLVLSDCSVSENPCFTAVQLLRRGEYLSIFADMRSSNLPEKLRSDLCTLQKLAEESVRVLRVNHVCVYLNIKSAHVLFPPNNSSILRYLLDQSMNSQCHRRHTAALVFCEGGRMFSGINTSAEVCKYGCIRNKNGLVVGDGTHSELCFGLHAEQIAIAKALQHGKPSELFSIYNPCVNCAKAIVIAGIKHVHYFQQENSQTHYIVERLFADNGIEIIK